MLNSAISKLIIGAIAGITVMSFNTKLSTNITEKLNKTSSIISTFKSNEDVLVEKYNLLNEDATKKIEKANSIIESKNETISKLQKEIENLKK